MNQTTPPDALAVPVPEHNPDGLPEMEQFRFLSVGETLQAGDEFWHRGIKQWYRTAYGLGATSYAITADDFTYRRSTATTPLTAQHNYDKHYAELQAECERLKESLRLMQGERDDWISIAGSRLKTAMASQSALQSAETKAGAMEEALRELKHQVVDVILPNAKNITLDFGQVALWDACVGKVDALLLKGGDEKCAHKENASHASSTLKSQGTKQNETPKTSASEAPGDVQSVTTGPALPPAPSVASEKEGKVIHRLTHGEPTGWPDREMMEQAWAEQDGEPTP